MIFYVPHRCFPACSIRGHTKGGFCGRPLQVLFEIKEGERTTGKKAPEDFLSKLVFIAEIRPEGVPGLSSNLIVDKARVQAMVRSNVRVNGVAGELVLGKVVHRNSEAGKLCMQVDFNSEQHSWDYSWKSNRWEVNKTHVIDVMILEESRNNSFHVLRNFPSKTFTIFSARHIKTSSERGSSTATLSHSVNKRPPPALKSSTTKCAERQSLKTPGSPAHVAMNYASALSMQMGFPLQHYQYNPEFLASMVASGDSLRMLPYPQSNYTNSSSSESGSHEDDNNLHYNYSSTTIISSSDEDGLDAASPVAAKRRRLESEETGRPGGNKLLELCGIVSAATRGYSFDEDDWQPRS